MVFSGSSALDHPEKTSASSPQPATRRTSVLASPGRHHQRTDPGLKLTSVGEMFARHVMTVTQDEDRFRSDLQSLSGTWRGVVRIACIEALAESLLPDVMMRHRNRAKRVTFSAHTMGSFEIHDVLVRGEADIVMAFALRPSPELRQVSL